MRKKYNDHRQNKKKPVPGKKMNLFLYDFKTKAFLCNEIQKRGRSNKK